MLVQAIMYTMMQSIVLVQVTMQVMDDGGVHNKCTLMCAKIFPNKLSCLNHANLLKASLISDDSPNHY